MSLSDQNAAARLAGLLDSAMDAIVTVDESQAIVMYNRAAERIFGWTAREAVGRPLDMLIPNRFRATHADHVHRFGATGVTSRRMSGSSVVYGLRKNGGEFPVDASISQLDSPEGKLYTVILRDVTERVRAQEDLAAFAKQAGAIREQEKSRVARELHDELAQSLSALKMDTMWLRERVRGNPETAAKVEDMAKMLDGAVASTRRIAADLRPLVLDDLGLMPAIDWLVQNFQQRAGIACTLHAAEDLELQEPYATAVFRILQESLVNVAKHAKASRVDVTVQPAEGGLRLKVQDDGIGFDPAAPRKPGSLGIAGVRERAQLLKGSVVVHSKPGQGTVIDAFIPVREESE